MKSKSKRNPFASTRSQKSDEMTNIRVTKSQLEDLLTLVYLGNWVVNAIHVGDEEETKYEEMEQYILSCAHQAGLKRCVIFDEKHQEFYPTKEFEESPDIADNLDEYNEEIFWEEVIDRLARRDFLREYGLDSVKGMSWQERIEKESPFIDRYEDEFAQNGLDNVEIRKLVNFKS